MAAASSSHQMTQEEREHIDKVACYVARDRDRELTEYILLKLLRLTGNHRRWGFLTQNHPHHSYYVGRKVSEQCRISEQCRALRPRHPT